jgi:anion-transporting  ArsA/GET3 family ATPase
MNAGERRMTSGEVLSELLKRRLLIVVGKGGVGKTTICSVLASITARTIGETLAMETDLRAPLAAAFGQAPSLVPVEISPGLATMVLDGRHALEEYLQIVVPGRIVLKAVFASKLYQYFVQAAPGLRELMMLGKIYYELERKPSGQRKWQMVVLDAAASGQALGLLKMPEAAHDTFGESIVGREANNIGRMLHDQRLSAVILVTTAEPMALSETIETEAALHKLGLNVAAIVLNRYKPKSFGVQDVARLKRRAPLRRHLNHLDHLSALANQELERTTQAREALATLRAETKSPIIELREYRGLFGTALVRRLADDLSGVDGDGLSAG